LDHLERQVGLDAVRLQLRPRYDPRRASYPGLSTTEHHCPAARSPWRQGPQGRSKFRIERRRGLDLDRVHAIGVLQHQVDLLAARVAVEEEIRRPSRIEPPLQELDDDQGLEQRAAQWVSREVAGLFDAQQMTREPGEAPLIYGSAARAMYSATLATAMLTILQVSGGLLTDHGFVSGAGDSECPPLVRRSSELGKQNCECCHDPVQPGIVFQIDLRRRGLRQDPVVRCKADTHARARIHARP